MFRGWPLMFFESTDLNFMLPHPLRLQLSSDLGSLGGAIGKRQKPIILTSNARMKSNLSICVKLFLAVAFCWTATCGAAESPKITALKARLFLQHSGEFSPPLTG